jgi:phage terminase large subunit GpA-like protein
MLAIERYRAETALYAQRVFSHRRKLTAPQWAEQVRRMEGGRRYRFEFAPYQREMMETPFLPEVDTTVFMMPSRTGKTETVMNIIGHAIGEDPRKILVMYPTNSAAEKWSKETLMTELVYSTQQIYDLIGDGEGRRKSGNTILHKIFPGGLLNAMGSNAPTELRRAKGNLLFADEIDAYEFTSSDEGDQLEILWMRGSEYPDTIKIAASYPSLRGQSKIEGLMLQSDYRKWNVPCPRCKSEFVLHRDQLRYEIDKLKEARLECPLCKGPISDQERRDAMRAGRWVATRPFNGVAGFHGSGMMSPHPVQKGFVSHLHWVAAQEVKIEQAANREKSKRVFINTFDAETYQPPEEEKPDPEGLAMEAYDYLEKINDTQYRIPWGVCMVTAGVDVQGDRLELEFVGFGLNGQEWGLGYHVLQGRPEEPEVWAKLDSLLQTEFVHPSETILKAVCTFVDSKFRMIHVKAFTGPRRPRNVFAIHGATRLAAPALSKPRKDTRGIVSYEIGTNELKSLIYQNSSLRWDKKTGEAPHNYMHFPLGHGYSPEYFKMLLVEDVELKKGEDGDYYQSFSNPKRMRNEPLDLRVYAKGGERKMNPNYAILAKKLKITVPESGEDGENSEQKGRNYALNRS